MEISFESINIAMDFVLIIMAFWMVWSARGLGGVVGKAMGFITVGAVILGFAHLSETISFEVLHMEIGPGELLHRVIILVGFLLLALGLGSASRIVRRK